MNCTRRGYAFKYFVTVPKHQGDKIDELFKDGYYKEALKIYECFVEGIEDNEEKAEVYQKMACIC